MFHIIVLLLIVIFWLWAEKEAKQTATHAKQTAKQRVTDYQNWLGDHEGLTIFCYTNREKFCDTIERVILPSLDDSIEVVKLIGKNPQTTLDAEMVAYALYRINNIGFPNVMKIVDGHMIDLSLHKTLYDCISQGNTERLPKMVADTLLEITRHHSQ